MEWRHHEKMDKEGVLCLFSFFHYFKYYGQNIFSRAIVSYLIIAKVERKE